MISELNIKDLGVIANSTIALGSGFTAITGETGAGKTMIVTALGLLMGERSDAALVREGASQARITGIIETAKPQVLDIVDEVGGETEEGELLITRTVNVDSVSRAGVGGARCPVRVLSRLASEIFCVHGQNDQLRLKTQHEQRETLDRFGGAAVSAARAAYESVYTRRLELEREHTNITENREQRRQQAEQLRRAVEDISLVDPQPDEIELLRARIEKLGNLESLRANLARAVNLLAAEGSDATQCDAQMLIGQAAQAAQDAASVDKTLSDAVEQLQDIATRLQDVTADLVRYSDDLEGGSEAELEQAQQRIAELTRLERVYGTSLQGLWEYHDIAAERLSVFSDDDTRLQEITAELEELRSRQTEAAVKLTELRQAAAAVLGERVTAELAALALSDSSFLVEIRSQEPTITGADEIAFMLIPYTGAAPKPLSKTASGGELSRIMLALEVVLAGSDPVPTFVFDEIDAGIGGAAAIEVGKRLAKLAQSAQVIVVTHLAQVAAFADNHLSITKDASGGFTQSSCKQLSGDARLAETARLLSGLSDSESALQHAAELVAMGRAELKNYR
ncbi:DNA repair protein RecN [Canibacter sp. lx-72]|uniref:DNA repair protein RecN n=1 Tax=Canibacter zhuwentaonis TaxID=2837491 RepID=UPI001BDD0380|nr:DNA repair protein RecN [Canibacter zhuwentaonis]MBT1018375.1 DNA repair protein RecN [Canibacter zhuwentaonis]